MHGLCRALAGRGHEVVVFTTNVDGPDDSDVPLDERVDLDGVTVRYFPSRRLRRLYWSPPMKAALVRDVGGFDLVHLHSVFLWPTSAAAAAARRASIPYVISPRGMLVPELIRRRSRFVKTLWLQLFEHPNFRHAAAIHFTSRREWEDARRVGIPVPRGFVVGNGVERVSNERRATSGEEGEDGRGLGRGDVNESGVSRRTPEPPARAQSSDSPLSARRFVLFLGRISWKKGLDRLVRAMALVPEAQLVIAGNDEEGLTPRLQELAGAMGVAERVVFVGHVGGPEKEDLLDSAAMLVLPSISENFGNVVLEAMAAGCPVVTTPEVGAAEIVEEEGAGQVVAGEPHALGSAIAELLRDEAARLEMGERGRIAARRYTWEVVAERMEEEYARVRGRMQNAE